MSCYNVKKNWVSFGDCRENPKTHCLFCILFQNSLLIIPRNTETSQYKKAHVTFAVLCYRFRDTHNRAYYMVLAGTRWLGIRLDLLSALLVGAVALILALHSHNSGKHNIVVLNVTSTADKSDRNISEVCA